MGAYPCLPWPTTSTILTDLSLELRKYGLDIMYYGRNCQCEWLIHPFCKRHAIKRCVRNRLSLDKQIFNAVYCHYGRWRHPKYHFSRQGEADPIRCPKTRCTLPCNGFPDKTQPSTEDKITITMYWYSVTILSSISRVMSDSVERCNISSSGIATHQV